MYIFDIKRYAINDGPGIRTTLFIKGCPLRCVWCHNPEGWSSQRQILYKKSKCIGCSSCVNVCPQGALEMTKSGVQPTKASCLLCGKCTNECPTMALEICGRDWNLDELMAEVEKERTVMENSGGGVTLCGGEPMLHHKETILILQELGRRGFHRTVDTTLYASSEIVKAVSAECELFLVDIKLMDSKKHRYYTGVPNEPILENIRLLDALGKDFYIRIPLIECVNTDEENIEAVGRFLNGLVWPRKTVNLLPYHDVGKDKHHRMWSNYNPEDIPMKTPSDDIIKRCASQLEAFGLNFVVGG